jgi:hypothetical protein
MPSLRTLFREKPPVGDDPVKIVQAVLSESGTSSLDVLVRALNTILDTKRWQAGGFETFGDFAVALPPTGLGVRSTPPLKLLRYALLAGRHYTAWIAVLERTARGPGRPFYRVSTSTTACDRLLQTLKRDHPEHFARVCKGTSPRSAAISAGLIESVTETERVHNLIPRAALLPPDTQREVLCGLFIALDLEAQCELIVRHLEPRLGPGLAGKWRSISAGVAQRPDGPAG